MVTIHYCKVKLVTIRKFYSKKGKEYPSDNGKSSNLSLSIVVHLGFIVFGWCHLYTVHDVSYMFSCPRVLLVQVLSL